MTFLDSEERRLDNASLNLAIAINRMDLLIKSKEWKRCEQNKKKLARLRK